MKSLAGIVQYDTTEFLGRYTMEHSFRVIKDPIVHQELSMVYIFHVIIKIDIYSGCQEVPGVRC